jgi:EpsI family protein
VLESAIPRQFGDWREAPQGAVQVVNPQTQELLDKLYSQTLSRTYVNSHGYRVMLSLAYGDDQRGGLQAHMPEVCYPAQGFTVNGVSEQLIKTRFGNISGKRVSTSLGARQEPITYWFAMGDRTVRSGWEKRVVELRLGLTGQVPDGLLFRISSIDGDAATAYQAHNAFANDVLAALSQDNRRKVTGLAN